jgi:hypothetical protein
VAVSPLGEPLTASMSYDEDVNRYIDFLDKGLADYKQNK